MIPILELILNDAAGFDWGLDQVWERDGEGEGWGLFLCRGIFLVFHLRVEVHS